MFPGNISAGLRLTPFPVAFAVRVLQVVLAFARTVDAFAAFAEQRFALIVLLAILLDYRCCNE